MILIIDNYDSFTFNLVQAFGALGVGVKVVRNDTVELTEIEDMAPSHLVISPGPGRPRQAPINLAAIHHFAGSLPILGVCLGHQAICQALGGRIIAAPSPIHGRAFPIYHDGKGIFTGLANPFWAARYHSLIADAATLPECLEVSATSDGLIQAVRHRQHENLIGIQFHPESFMTQAGPELLRNFILLK